jgi:DNA modification methylase
MQLLEKSINEVGVIESISVTKEGTIISGHARKATFDKQGKKPKEVHLSDNEYPVIVRADIEDDTELYYKAQILANTTSKQNIDLDTELIEEIAVEYDLDIEELGVDLVEDTETHLEAEEDDFDTTPPEEPITVLGDLYEIGEHRLLCGDSTDSDQVAKLMNGSKADMVFTDPPYGINYKSNHRKNNSNVQFDVLENDDKFLDFKPNLILYSKESSAWFIWTSHQVYPIWREMYDEYYINTIIWNKGKMSMGDLSSYGNNYEMALFCSQGKPKLKGERKKAIWEINVESGSEYVHPTQKPVTLASFAIPDLINVNDLVLDLFLGSGSTMVASHQLKRKCYGMELDPKYCDVIVRRMVKLDPTLVIKRNGEVTKEFNETK